MPALFVAPIPISDLLFNHLSAIFTEFYGILINFKIFETKSQMVNVKGYKLSVISPKEIFGEIMAEGVGFEPTELSLNGFQDRRLRPLGHPSDYNCGPVRP